MRAPRPCRSCEAHHDETYVEVAIGDDGLERLGECVQSHTWRRILLVADANTHDVVGARLDEDLSAAGTIVRLLVYPDRRHLRAEKNVLAEARAAVSAASADAVLAVGSGTITDIARWASFSESRPFCAVATAPSMDGYASSVAALQLDGVKVTYPAHAPVGVFADPRVVAAAPAAMARAGLGDLLGKVSASYDWRLGHAVTGEAYCEEIDGRVGAAIDACTGALGGILDGRPDSISTLLAGLVTSGTCMTAFASSRPASGSEHHLSHFWDLLWSTGRRTDAPHGLQVGYATTFTTRMQRLALDGLGTPLARAPGALDDAARSWLGPSGTFAAIAQEKGTAHRLYGPTWPPDPHRLSCAEDELAAACERFPAALAALYASGVPSGVGHLGVDADTLRATLRYANRLRSRFTVLDLLEEQGRLDQVIDVVLGES